MKKVGFHGIKIISFLLLSSTYSNGLANELENTNFTMGSSKYIGTDGLPYCRYNLTVEGSNWGSFNAIVRRTGYEIKPDGTRGAGSYVCITQNHGNYKFSNDKFMSGSSS